MPEDNLLNCYNRGCGQKFDPSSNNEDECRYHPGVPFFHDAYKGWSCCNKKCTDFTEFLNIKGCTLGKHSNIKPAEPEKPQVDKELQGKEIIEVKTPSRIVESKLVRPAFESELTTMVPHIADSIKQVKETICKKADDGAIELGTSCKNGGCNTTYEGPESDTTECIHHPGVPVFHEGLKFWSCCQKKTTDFNTFLNQPGCEHGNHKWKKESQVTDGVKCRWDWHQTPDHVIVSIYAKHYNPDKSYVKLNPIRLQSKVVFPMEGDASFDLDIELRGMIDITQTSVSMLGSKVEIKMRKAEPGSWSKLDFPRELKKKPNIVTLQPAEVEDDMVDLSGIESISAMGQINLSGV